MAGIRDLNKLLSSMSPKFLEGEYVFCTVPGGIYGDYKDLNPLASFMESEGLTLVINKEDADRSALQYESSFKCITLTIHSSLEAVGLTAAVSKKLSDNNISANIIAAYYHDHLFVPLKSAEKALILLSDFCK